MQKILRIAKLELSLLFYSPIAWLILIVFTIQSGLVFTDMLYAQETQQQLGRSLNVLTKVLFAGDTGTFKAVQENLYLYIPLLTMGLMSREISSGSIKLLYSSPITLRQIVLGKYLAMMLYGLLFVLILTIYMGAAFFSVHALEIWFVLGGMLGLYLLVCVYAAIGLFMSSLTAYQVVAAISTLAVLTCLNFIGEVGQNYDLIREITYWLSIKGRVSSFINGPLTSRDTLYFILVIFLFISLTIMRLSNQQAVRSKQTNYLRYALLIVACITGIYISSLPKLTAYWDTTRGKDRTLSLHTQALLKRLDAPITLTTYTNIIHHFAGYGAPENRMSDRLSFEGYRRFLPDMKMVYVPYYDTLMYRRDTHKTLEEQAREAADALGFDFDRVLSPRQLKKQINLLPEENRMVRFLEYKGKKVPLRMFDDMLVYPKEAEVSAAIEQLLDPPVTIGVVSGHGERDVNRAGNAAYKAILNGVGLRASMLNQGFENQLVFPDKPISGSIDILIIADPKKAYTAAEIKHILAYVEAGGNLLISGEPGREAYLNPVLQALGLQYQIGTVLQESEDFDLDLVQAKLTPQAQDMGFNFYPDAIVSMPGTMAILQVADKGFDVQPLLISDARRTWNKTSTFDLAVDQVRFNPKKESKASFPLAFALSRKKKEKQQKIIVMGDADFMSNAELNRFNLTAVNVLFTTRMFKWFTDGKYPFSTDRPQALDTQIKVNRRQINLQKVLFFALIPGVLLMLGMVILIRRRRH